MKEKKMTPEQYLQRFGAALQREGGKDFAHSATDRLCSVMLEAAIGEIQKHKLGNNANKMFDLLNSYNELWNETAALFVVTYPDTPCPLKEDGFWLIVAPRFGMEAEKALKKENADADAIGKAKTLAEMQER